MLVLRTGAFPALEPRICATDIGADEVGHGWWRGSCWSRGRGTLSRLRVSRRDVAKLPEVPRAACALADVPARACVRVSF